MRDWTVEITIRQQISALTEDVAQQRADLMAQRASVGILSIKSRWLGDQESAEATVEEDA